MDCRLNYVKQITDDIKETIGVDRTSAKLVKPLQILLPVGGKDGNNKSLQTKDNTYNWAKSIQKQVNTKYNAKVFGNIIDIDNKSNNLGTLVNILIPSKLIDAYEQKYGQKTYFQLPETQVNFSLKSIEILNSDKAKQIFEKGKKSNWSLEKILQELQIPKDQKDLILSLGKTNREDIITDLLANYSYTIEINTAKNNKGIYDPTDINNFDPDYLQENLGKTKGQNTNFYANLTVPGGTNYTENEIATPVITPSIKGHAQFSTDNGIGWFRSDDKIIAGSEGKWESDGAGGLVRTSIADTDTKTRRILEVQSDLFQKGRDKSILNKDPLNDEKGFEKAGFLNLLNKDNNWVTFFIKSIIQDSAKKGYEKVLFPTGNTAAKIEGHETLADEIKSINNKLDLLEDDLKNGRYVNEDNEVMPTKSELENQIKQLEKRKSELKSQGLEKLKPIEGFYENTVTNILKKQGYNPVLVTDEYGNTWNEIKINVEHLNKILLQIPTKTVDKKNVYSQEFEDKLIILAKNLGLDVKFVDSLKTKFGDTINGLFEINDQLQGVIKVSKDNKTNFTLSEELSHALIEGLSNTPTIDNILRLTKQYGYENVLLDQTKDYEQLYNNDKELLVKEAAGKLLSQALYNNFNTKDDKLSKLYKALQFLWNKIKFIFKNTSDQTLDSLNQSINDLALEVLADKHSNLTFNNEVKLAQLNDKTKPKLKKQPKYFNQIIELRRAIKRLKSRMSKLDSSSKEYSDLREQSVKIQAGIDQFITSNNLEQLTNAGDLELDNIQSIIDDIESGKKSGLGLSDSQLTQILDTLESLDAIPDLSKKAKDLKERFTPILQQFVENLVNQTSTEEEEFTYDDLINETEDINSFTKSFGSLVNLKNKIARTIGFLIKQAQIKVSSEQGKLYEEVKTEVAKLRQWASKNNISNPYEVFIQKYKNTTILTKPYSEDFYNDLDKAFKDKTIRSFAEKVNGEWIPLNKTKYKNPNYDKIQKTPELKAFYDFYQKTITEALDRLPADNIMVKYKDQNFIPNIIREDLKDIIKAEGFGNKFKGLVKYMTDIKVDEVNNKDFVNDETLEKDIVPLKYLAKLTGDKKSNDLGESLYRFAAMSIEHEHLSEVLPQTRLLQRTIADTKYTKSSDQTKAIAGVDTNLYTMVDKFIDMQLRGIKKYNQGKIPIGDLVDENGKTTGKKYVYVSDLADFGLRYNSLLRIGFNPFNAVTNVLVGELGNIVESVGGRFYNKKDLANASNIFFKDIFNKDSKTNKLLEKLNPLQELEDYTYATNVSLKKGLSGEKLKNYLYLPQKSGETFLQTRTMIAMMLHTKPDNKTSLWDMLDDNGNLKSEYKSIIPDFDEYMTRLSSRVQAINEKIHGRYSQRDAAIINQNVLWRMAFQFKKWIPAAIETRFGDKYYDNRLGVEMEGRWRTLYKMVTNLSDTIKRASTKELTELEVYNFRKSATEIVLTLATVLAYYGLGWDDDEKKKRSAAYKFTMDQLDKVSGDLLFMSNPKNVTALTKNPFAITKLADQLINTTKAIPYMFYIGDYEYKSGSRKGENKFYNQAEGLIPVVKPITDFIRLNNKTKYIEYNQ